MHPTPDEQLVAIERLIMRGTEGTRRGAEPTTIEADLTDASRLTRRLMRSWARRLPFLERDNELAIELLSSLVSKQPDLTAQVTGAIRARENADAGEPSAHQLNKSLQMLLADAVHALPDDEAGDADRARIAAHLRARLAANPALHREPALR